MHLSEKIKYIDLLQFVNVDAIELDRLEDSYNDYPSNYWYEWMSNQIKEVQEKFFARYKYPINICDFYEYEEIMTDIFYDGVEGKDIRKELVEEVEYFMNDKVAKLFCKEINFKFELLDGEDIEIEIKCEDPKFFLALGMNAYGEWDWDLHSEEDKEGLCKPYYIIRECLHYYEACESKPRLNFSINFDNMYVFNEDEYSIFDKMMDKWLNGEIIGEILIEEDIPGVNSGSYRLKDLPDEFDYPEKFDSGKVMFVKKRRGLNG